VFYDPETEAEVRAEIIDGRYAVDLLDRPWAVYLDMREVDGELPQMRALTHETIRPNDTLDLDVSTVLLRGTYTVDGTPAPDLGERWGFLQIVDALGIAGAGVSVQDGSFEGRVYASRASLVFVGTHSTAPRLAQTVAEGLVLGLSGWLLCLLLCGPAVWATAKYGIDFSQFYGEADMSMAGILLDPVIYADFGWWMPPLGFGLSIAATLLSSLYPAWYALGTDPATALRAEG